MLSNRKLLLIIFILCVGSILYALYAQYYQFVTLCPLCSAQRIIIIIIGILCLLFAIHNPKGFLMRIYGLIVGGFAIFGIKVAARHVWLMSLSPEQQPVSCGIPLEVLYQRVPLHSFIGYILKGDGECSKINWTIFGLTAPTTVIILCSIITLLAVYIVFRKKSQK